MSLDTVYLIFLIVALVICVLMGLCIVLMKIKLYQLKGKNSRTRKTSRAWIKWGSKSGPEGVVVADGYASVGKVYNAQPIVVHEDTEDIEKQAGSSLHVRVESQNVVTMSPIPLSPVPVPSVPDLGELF
ncbi:hypothetical protein HDU67_004834 [Dinochytrium kinnereticum]|nr:hypothetical protein HDU67_004834 [Dinochytrium kinnereticum]